MRQKWYLLSLPGTLLFCYAPVGLPDVQRFLVHVVVSLCLFIQEVEEVFDCRRDDGAGAEHAAKEIIHKLLQSAL